MGTDADNDNDDDNRGESAEAAGIGINPFPPLIIPKSALMTLTLQFQLNLPLLPPHPSSPFSPSSPMFLSLSFPLSSISSLRRRPLPPDLPLRSPRSFLQINLDTNLDLDPDLDIVVDALEAAVPLELFLLLL